jgi:hypothetical protein
VSDSNKPQDPPTDGPGARDSAFGDLAGHLKGSSSRVAELLEKVFPFLPERDRLVALFAGLAIILTLGLSVGFFYGGDHQLAFWLAMAALASLVLYAVLHFLRDGPAPNSTARVSPPEAATPTWSRKIPRLPLPADRTEELASDLQHIRDTAFMWLNQRHPDVKWQANEVRANVFLADYTQATSGDVCTLFMPDGLRVGMDGSPDERIRFRPRQGATGLVFIKQDGSIAKTFETTPGKHEFSELYELTEEQKRAIHPDLRWIVSFPLNAPDGNRRKASGVLNVDGLKHELSEDELNLLWAALSKHVARFTDKLALIPMIRVVIALEDVSDG